MSLLILLRELKTKIFFLSLKYKQFLLTYVSYMLSYLYKKLLEKLQK